MSKDHFLLFKTADAEKRAWRNLEAERQNAITPIVELTRGRKNRGTGKAPDGSPLTAEQLVATPGVYGFEKGFQSSLDLMKECERFFIDITREPTLNCFEIEQLTLSSNGYENWTNFVIARDDEGRAVRPTLIVNPAEGDSAAQYIADLTTQFQTFAQKFTEIAYRVSILEDDGFLHDLVSLKSEVDSFRQGGGKFYVVLDHEYVRPGNGHVHSKRTAQIIQTVLDTIGPIEVVVMATSFPKSVTDVGDEEHDIFRVEEIYLFEEVRKAHPNILYGDYGSINPIRNDEVIIVNGWRPRIDFISRREGMNTYYFREKRKVVGTKLATVKGVQKMKNVLAPYSPHYASVARSVMSFAPYYENIDPSWGNSEIKKAASGSVPSNSPSHWISVRMEIHIVQVLKYFGIDPL
ncbi:hypothetical protein [Pseudophaeobacter sp.]|uniref:beta family protein n=1 Tax=Pseudophaeobacter sp. TaxID=1971739 RepID=UPI003299C6D5